MRSFLLFVVAVLLLPAPEYGQSTTLPAPSQIIVRDPQAMTVLANASSVLGGSVAAQITDSVVQATETSAVQNSSPASITLKSKGLDEFRMEGATAGVYSAVVMHHGIEQRLTKSGWVTDPSSNAVKQRITHLPSVLIGQELARADMSAAYIAAESINGRSVHHLRLARVSSLGSPIDAQLTKNSEIEIYIDATTGLVDKISYVLISRTDWRVGFPVEVYYDQYQSIRGMQIPFHQRYVYNSGPPSDLQITSVQFNVGLTDTDFEVK